MSTPQYAINRTTAANAAITAPFLVLRDGLKRMSQAFTRREVCFKKFQIRFSFERCFNSSAMADSFD
jgi:hypothetical protein